MVGGMPVCAIYAVFDDGREFVRRSVREARGGGFVLLPQRDVVVPGDLVFPSDFAVGGCLEYGSRRAVGDERVAVGEALGAGYIGRVEVGGGLGGVCPRGVGGRVRRVAGAAVAVAVNGGDDFVHGGVATLVAGEFVAVVEH